MHVNAGTAFIALWLLLNTSSSSPLNQSKKRNCVLAELQVEDPAKVLETILLSLISAENFCP
jgi:hypothetical protein